VELVLLAKIFSHEYYQIRKEFGLCVTQNIRGMNCLISVIYKMQTA